MKLLIFVMVIVLWATVSCSLPQQTTPVPFPAPEGYSSWDEYQNSLPQNTDVTNSHIAVSSISDDESLSHLRDMFEKSRPYIESLFSDRNFLPINGETERDDPHHIIHGNYIEVGADNEPIYLVNNPSATNVSLSQLMDFIEEDITDQYLYDSETFVCADYAENLHNNAEKSGIKSAWVGITFLNDDSPGHALNAFETIDKGMVFVDCTSEDSIAYCVINEEYLRFTIDGEYFSVFDVVKSIQIFWGN
jgi:hypothetical protein